MYLIQKNNGKIYFVVHCKKKKNNFNSTYTWIITYLRLQSNNNNTIFITGDKNCEATRKRKRKISLEDKIYSFDIKKKMQEKNIFKEKTRNRNKKKTTTTE